MRRKFTKYPILGASNDMEDFDIHGTALVNYKGAGGDVVIPDGVTSIGDSAFFTVVV